MTSTFAAVLEQTGQILDVSIADQERAIARYDHLAKWLIDEQVGRADVLVYPQGSFRLGTVVRPSDLGGDFDIDLVFLRDLAKGSTTQEALKANAGELLTRYADTFKLDAPIELGRCWRLEFFDDGFHLDILPVIPDPDVVNGILLSDRDLRLWLPSNPIGYADWFYERMNQQLLNEGRIALAKQLGRSIDEVPRFFVRTPLQRIVQLLKRSRDEYFADASDICPASILLTTLAARAYRGQVDVDRALTEVVADLPNHVENRDGTWWVENPAHEGENFADKWNTNPDRREAFFEWLGELSTSVVAAARADATERVSGLLEKSLGGVVTDAAAVLRNLGSNALHKAASGDGRAPHEEFIQERFHERITERVAVNLGIADSIGQNRYHRRRDEKRRRLGKHRSLRFAIAETSVREPFDVYWKVRNFGREAMLKNQLRGQITSDDGSRTTVEGTSYRGDHFVDCYVVKDGVCVAKCRTWVPIE